MVKMYFQIFNFFYFFQLYLRVSVNITEENFNRITN